MKTRITFILGLALILTTTLSAAQPTEYTSGQRVTTAREQRALEPDEIVAAAIRQVRSYFSADKKVSGREIAAFLHREIAPHFDFTHMTRYVAGPLYRRLDNRQRQRFAQKLQQSFFSALAENLGAFAYPMPPTRVHLPRWRNNGREAVVVTRILPTYRRSVPPTRLEFRFSRSADGWKVFDVSANGTSAIIYYRGYFRNLIRRNGLRAALS